MGYVLARFVYFRALALVFAIAFVSLWVQVDGLVGSHGILPIGEYMEAARTYLGGVAWLDLPTFAWWFPSDGALHAQCALGVALSLALFVGFAPRLCLLLLWLLYLSLVVAGQDFLSFQWDVLLLETALFSIPFAPAGWRPGLAASRPPSRFALFLVRWLLFRLMFSSGIVKLTSGDSSWTDGSALGFHFWTQPLPNPLSWHAQQLPLGLHRFACWGMFAIEIGCGVAVLGPRSARRLAAAGIALLMFLIVLTGNYGFFNLLTLVLCVALLDDALWTRLLPARLSAAARERVSESVSVTAAPRSRLRRLVALPATIVALGAVLLSAFTMLDNFEWLALPAPLARAEQALAPFRSLNNYGLFRVMTKERREIELQGSDDGETWKPYVFRWKPGDPARSPGFAGPHMPRLDWQMWFAPLSPQRARHWFDRLIARLLEGEPSVLALLGDNPFPDAPPRFVRSQAWDYRFTTSAERARGAGWWARTPIALFTTQRSR